MADEKNNHYTAQRQDMVEQQLKRRGIRDPWVLSAMATVPRHVFVPSDVQAVAYADSALPIGQHQTISQPYIVAFMAQAARLGPRDRVLEIGTGSGYGAAVLSRIVKEVYTVERHIGLLEQARERFKVLGYDNIYVKHNNGSEGWPEQAPFDAIIVTAAAAKIPEPLTEQLVAGGRLVVPVGTRNGQTLMRVTRHEGRLEQRSLIEVRFVPLVGEYGWETE